MPSGRSRMQSTAVIENLLVDIKLEFYQSYHHGLVVGLRCLDK